jgi:hypothetical protein
MMNPATMKHSTVNVYLLNLGFTVHYATFPRGERSAKSSFRKSKLGFLIFCHLIQPDSKSYCLFVKLSRQSPSYPNSGARSLPVYQNDVNGAMSGDLNQFAFPSASTAHH